MMVRGILPAGLGMIFAASVLLLTSACGDDGPLHPEGVGNACTEDADCPTNNCYLGPAGGYCTATCQDEGSTDQCPVDTVCKPAGPLRRIMHMPPKGVPPAELVNELQLPVK